jgi:PKD repeat protein
VGIPLEYAFTASDMDYDDIYYCIRWDNASREECVGAFSVFEEGSATHIYMQAGSYTIRMTAKNRYDFVSEETTLLIPMTKYRNLEKNENINDADANCFYLLFGFMIADAVINESESHTGDYVYQYTSVEKVTLMVLGFFYTLNDTEFDKLFYMKSFTNVSELLFLSSTKFDVSDEYQHMSFFVIRDMPCTLIFNL